MSGRPLRCGEWLALVAAIVLAADLFALHWYARPAATGFDAMAVMRWFALVAAALGIALTVAQAALRGPSLAVTLDMVAMLGGGVTTILIAIRLVTTGASLAAGAYVGVVAAAAVTAGAYRAMRAEQGWDADPAHPERPVELVEL